MARILIASIGTGNFVKDPETGEFKKQYQRAKYALEDGRYVESAYIYDALIEFKGVDKLILTGTCGSNWQFLYEHLYDPDSKITPQLPYDKAFSEGLAAISQWTQIDKLPVREFSPLLEKLKATMGDKLPGIVLLKYGVNQAEITENFELLATATEDYVQDGDSICFDITHAFRTLPIFELLAVSYFKNLVKKDVTIDFVSYGLFDQKVQKQTGGLTPIVDYPELLSLMELLKAAEEYKRFGTLYILADFLKAHTIEYGMTDKHIDMLYKINSEISLGNLGGFRDLMKQLALMNTTAHNHVILRHIIGDLVGRFGEIIISEDEIMLLSEIALWQLDNKRYLIAAITIVDSFADACAKLTGLDKEIVEVLLHDKAKKVKQFSRGGEKVIGDSRPIESGNPNVKKLIAIYNEIRPVRSHLAHSKGNYKSPDKSPDAVIERFVREFHALYRDSFFGNAEAVAELARVLKQAYTPIAVTGGTARK